MKVAKKTLISTVGVAAAVLLYATVPGYEGLRNTGYLDPVGIPTKCFGDTQDVVVGQYYSTEECLRSLETQLIAHAEPVLACTPALENHPYQLASAVSFAYNVGTGAYCKSTVARRFNSGDWEGACRSMNESDSGKPQWVTARGRTLPGLVRRRAEERKMCETNLPKSSDRSKITSSGGGF